MFLVLISMFDFLKKFSNISNQVYIHWHDIVDNLGININKRKRFEMNFIPYKRIQNPD